MNRFMGGFAVAAVGLGTAALAGRGWLAAGFGVATVVLVVFALACYSRRNHEDLPPVEPGSYAGPAVFADRGDIPARPRRNPR